MDIEDPNAKLLAEYSRELDTPTVLAILSDFDLTDKAQLATARQTLDILKEFAHAEEESGFEASAVPRGHTQDNPFVENETGSVSTRSATGWTSSTDSTSFHQDILGGLEGLTFGRPLTASSSSGEQTPSTPISGEFDALDHEGKKKVLIGIFPALKPFDIQWTLKKCKWDAGLAIDELMTQSFLEESGSRHKGIEAFSEEAPSRSKKSKKKRSKNQSKEESLKGSEEATPLQSKWTAGKEDVEFLSAKTGIPVPQITSIYHKNGASLQRTIAAIVKAHVAMGLESDDPIVQVNAFELQKEYPSILMEDMKALLQITHPCLSHARELAKVLSTKPPTAKPGSIQIEFQHAPPSPVEWAASQPFAKSQNKPPSTNTPQPDFDTASSKAADLHLARSAAMSQASASYRKAKSDPLMGGAAGYYAQVSRDLGDRAREMDSLAADALVARQSSRTELDLHGVSVKDAVRISRERVTMWWHELGEARAGGGFHGSFRIVTGLGTHSEGGKGKLGPAVGKMLIREGWKVEVGSGSIIVRGVVRK